MKLGDFRLKAVRKRKSPMFAASAELNPNTPVRDTRKRQRVREARREFRRL